MACRPRRGRLDLFPATKVDKMLERNYYSMNNDDIVPFFACLQVESKTIPTEVNVPC